jgi:GNAT superfamily N-acetyltransferase
MDQPISVRPVTRDDWETLVQFFEKKGSPHYCWCTSFRAHGFARMTSAEKKECLADLVRSGTPIGVLAYRGQDPIGWCSVAPRESYARLSRSRTMPRATPSEVPTWTVLCFFVVRPSRGQRVAHALLQGAVDYARAMGAAIIEGYPFDSAGIVTTHRGHSRTFAAAGFRPDGARWYRLLK